MRGVRRTLSAAGLVGLLVLAPSGAAFAAAPTPDPSATATPTATATTAASPDPTPSAPTAPSPAGTPSAEPSSGCDQDPQICQGGGAPGGTTTDCGQVNDGAVASPPPPGVVCIAGGIRPGTTAGGSGTGAGPGAPVTLPRTGPTSLVPTVTVGLWLLLLGVLLAIAGRRRTARL